MASADVAGDLPFVLSGVHVEPRQLPIAPEITLHLMRDDFPQESLGQADAARLMNAPPYWAFCWGAGQALARWILDNPQAVRGRNVVDFGAGSGVAGIAAGRAGAAQVSCVDIDNDALAACAKNSQINNVCVQLASEFCPGERSLLLAADICYQEQGFVGVIEYMQSGGDVIVAESRLRDLSERFPKLTKVGEYRVRTFPDLDESENYDAVHIYCTYQLSKKP